MANSGFPLILCIFVTITTEASSASSGTSRQVFADVTTNKLSREHDGTWGLWSYYGVAEESHASKTQFVFNADLVSWTGRLHHRDIASMVYPALGLTSDFEPAYQEYLILQGKVLGIDGLLIEWGYKGHSSDLALQSFLQQVKKYSDMKIGINWCDHWLMSKMENGTEKEIVKIFHENLQYLIDMVFALGPSVSYFHGNHPVIFIFGGGLNPSLFRELVSLPLDLPESLGSPLWIGSYLLFASSQSLSNDWKVLLNGTFGWSPYVLKPTPPWLDSWDFYGEVNDALEYQRNVSTFGEKCVSEGDFVMWCGSVSPGFDNRGCAGWGRELRLITRKDLETRKRSTYNEQWDFYIQGNVSTETIIIPTMNDFLESTPILALNESDDTLLDTFNHINDWKRIKADESGVYLPQKWYRIQKAVQYYQQTPGVNVSSLFAYLVAASQALNDKDFVTASQILENCRSQLELVTSCLYRSNLTLQVPSLSMSLSVPPVMFNGSYVVNSTAGLYLTMDHNLSEIIKNSNYKGFLKFSYLSLNSSLNQLQVFSPTKRKGTPFKEEKFFSSRNPSHSAKFQSMEGFMNVTGDFSEVCSLVTNSSGEWRSSLVEMFRINQSWDHTGPSKSDLHFKSRGFYLVQNISLEFQLVSRHKMFNKFNEKTLSEG